MRTVLAWFTTGCGIVLVNSVLIVGTFAGCLYAALWILRHFGIVK